MAVHTSLWRRFIEEHRFALNVFLQAVALRTPDIFVATGKWKLRPLVVIESRGRPALHRVAVSAGSHAILGRELRAVRVSVTTVTILRCVLKLNLIRAGKRLMAIAATYDSVRPLQIEFRFGMIESFDINPGAHVVASFAAQRRSIRSLCRHAIFEFTLVDIGMARGAGAVLEMERQDLIGAPGQADLVAFRARNCCMGSGQWKAGILMFGNRVGRPVEILHCVAFFTAIIGVGSGVELIVVRIFVAIHASCKFNFVNSIFAGRCVAFFALYRRMLSFQWIFGSGMFFHTEESGLPVLSSDGVTFRAFAFAGPRLELALMRIRRVAIRALVKFNRRLEIALRMALCAPNRLVHPFQRVFGLGVIKFRRQIVDDFPSARCVASVARAFECALVRIRVAARTRIKFQSPIFNSIVRGSREMALGAFHFGVQAR